MFNFGKIENFLIVVDADNYGGLKFDSPGIKKLVQDL
jgi:hypothetical protein